MNDFNIFGIGGMIFLLLIIALGVIVIVSSMKVWQTKLKSTNEQSYQKLSEDMIELQKQSNLHQENINQQLTQMNSRLKEVSRFLKEVE
ncbi:hypothetical protein [Alkalihalobacillus trypoxylicola]|uniref:Uncharacterized protein n=1 Tax=Alkalihalobacillus trypoxylicola TaxID=519424 RepID=A0A162F0E6_9BACI|nr:hypothetical protein [Alkalihalobacillus trypoxylicola]KYG34167.1 hypothetical protein AZF04_15200 [Alkalihalobacillus trypoxylicola]